MTTPAGTDPAKKRETWPTGWLAGGIVWAVVTLLLVPPAAEVATSIQAGGRYGPLFLIAARVALAHKRRDTGNGWLLWMLVLIFAAPLWLLFEAIAFPLLGP